MLPSEDDMQSFLDFLSEEPPNAAIGRIVHAAADLESGMFSLSTQYGLAHDKAWRKSIEERVKWLTVNSPVPHETLDRDRRRGEEPKLTGARHVDSRSDQRGFIKHVKDDSEHLHGTVVTEERLEGWRGRTSRSGRCDDELLPNGSGQGRRPDCLRGDRSRQAPASWSAGERLVPSAATRHSQLASRSLICGCGLLTRQPSSRSRASPIPK